MLTGDKLETAACIAKSSRLVGRDLPLYMFEAVTGRMEAHLQLNAFRKRSDHALLITGSSIEVSCFFFNYLDLLSLFIFIFFNIYTQSVIYFKLLVIFTSFR